MTTNDITVILDALSGLTTRMADVVERLTRIEERTSVLTDHETRLRAAEEAARKASETAVRAEDVAKGQALRIRAIEDAYVAKTVYETRAAVVDEAVAALRTAQHDAGRFSLGTLGKSVAALLGSAGVVAAIVAMVHSW